MAETTRQEGAEAQRLSAARDAQAAWRKWGPYLSERQWGTVREDYSQSGDAWNYFTHDHARSRCSTRRPPRVRVPWATTSSR